MPYCLNLPFAICLLNKVVTGRHRTYFLYVFANSRRRANFCFYLFVLCCGEKYACNQNFQSNTDKYYSAENFRFVAQFCAEFFADVHPSDTNCKRYQCNYCNAGQCLPHVVGGNGETQRASILVATACVSNTTAVRFLCDCCSEEFSLCVTPS